MDWNAEIEAARARTRGHLVKTPVLEVQGFGLDFPVEMKLEQMQHTGSFKARGAFNTLLSGGVPEGGVVAASGGNHGAAVAYAAHSLGIPAQIFVPEVAEPVKLAKLLEGWEPGRALIYCDETAAIASPLEALAALKPPAAVLIGPEGGFTDDEKAMLKSSAFVTAISLGPRIMRADTAAVAALTLVQAVLGDWHHKC